MGRNALAASVYRGRSSDRPSIETRLTGLVVDTPKTINIEPPELDAMDLQVLASNAISALRSAQEQFRIEAADLHTERDHLASEWDRIGEVEKSVREKSAECEGRVRNMSEMESLLAKRQTEMDSLASRIADDDQKLAANVAELDKHKQELAETVTQTRAETEALANTHKKLAAEREALSDDRRRHGLMQDAIEHDRSVIASEKAELDVKANGIAAKEAELSAAREALAAMQSQLTRDSEELARKREAILKAVGGSAITPAADETGSIDSAPDAFEPLPVPSRTPKPASSADQFRKLRRDAKRKTLSS